MGRLIAREELEELNRVLIKTDYREAFEEAAAVLDWLFRSGLDYPLMQGKIAALIRACVLMGRGELAPDTTYQDYVDNKNKKEKTLN